jgi:hypothetical protein
VFYINILIPQALAWGIFLWVKIKKNDLLVNIFNVGVNMNNNQQQLGLVAD